MDVRTRTVDGVLTVTLDDGQRNALRTETLAAVARALETAGPDVAAVVIAGREGCLSAGLDLKWMARAEGDDLRELLRTFGRTMMRVWTDPRPTVCAATGHAVAAGTMLAMACDHAVAAEGDFVWGLTETAIGMQLPDFGLALARHNLAADRLEDLVLPGRRLSPAEAVAAGYADELRAPDEVLERADAVARELATLPRPAYAGTKRRLREATAQAVLARLDDDVRAVTIDFTG